MGVIQKKTLEEAGKSRAHSYLNQFTCAEGNLSDAFPPNGLTGVEDHILLTYQIKKNSHLLHSSSDPCFRSLEQTSITLSAYLCTSAFAVFMSVGDTEQNIRRDRYIGNILTSTEAVVLKEVFPMLSLPIVSQVLETTSC